VGRDGIDITDMAATGASPTYYDFDAFEEMTINTGGVDVTQQTGGVGINLVTKSGTDHLKGSSRYYVTDDSSSRRTSLTPSASRRVLGQPDPEHQGLRHRSWRSDQERTRLGVGRHWQADCRHRRRRLLPAVGNVPVLQELRARAGDAD
jgi:hypothetical protein